MSKNKLLYVLMLVVIVIFIVYIAFVQMILDPQAATFLGFKTNLNHPLNKTIWLATMRVHVVSACIGMISGAVNFADWIRKKHRKFHKINGYVYLATVMIVGLTSGYMAPYATGGRGVSIAFNILTMLWPAFTVIAIHQIRKKQVQSHQKWMIRSYAYCFTNMTVHLLTSFFRSAAGWSYPDSYRISVYITIPLLYILAEVVIRAVLRKPKHAVRLNKS
ncbi:DUF2306 domain-containing protein [Paenibacillus sp. KQZ6P-2]|uniref:DUF2306 domain-containing protein n=1 Tax=Paenibacillus mangrovi TaxID=2931978 RepID=A0A9X2B7D3_9BACL|nr:DUF2306 domain-containing protein [Paenibacillus mangrovi]MCJ8014822.1 DUF2306 domain-containing protein [Paenibacillus mangrovi]